MGVDQAPAIARRLMLNGMDPAMPVAVIENGTLPSQKIVTGALAALGRLVRESAIQGPALIVIGKVAALAQADQADPAVLAAG
jgi:siroheme synthase